MKKFLLIITLVLSLQNNAQTPSQDQNYILATTYQKGYIKGQEQNALISEKIVGVNYFDGLGRPNQSAAVRAGGANQDIITHIDYDAFGRQAKDYLPYAAASNGGAIRTDVLSATNSFYLTSKYENTINPYSEKLFEASQLNRVMQQAAPGASWKLGIGHEIKFDYQTNIASEVKLYTATAIWNATSGLYNTGLVNGAGTVFYGAGQLHKTVTYDENTAAIPTEINGSTVEFKNKQGQVVLKRTYNAGAKHDTYYVYDDYGNLTYVIPPKVEVSITTAILDELCYQYKYDNRNRLVEKKIPGKGWEYIVYDKLDRPILTQDANQRLINQWSFTKYDAFNRVAYTGILIDGDGFPRAYMENEFSGTTLSETKLSTNQNILNTTIYYSNNSTPNLNYGDVGTEIQTINYYDNYTFDKDILTIPDTSEGQAIINYNNLNQGLTKGLSTGSKVRVLGTTSWITTITGYDAKARPIYAASRNNYLSTTDVVTSLLDFVGKVDKTTTSHSKGTTNIITEDLFTYDHTGRLKKQTQELNNTNVLEVILENTYDELGQLTIKGVGGKTSRLQTVNYAYNIRGWLKQINDPNNLGTDLFAFKINYNTKELGDSNSLLYNGNISETIWKTANDNTTNKTRGYAYTYDGLNRITNANYGIKTTGAYNLASGFDVGIGNYDKNGNIKSLWRDDITNNHKIDQLTYNYHNSEVSNKLKKVEDSSANADGFKNGANLTEEYTYDVNSNMITDANKGITAITYNHLNLPTKVTFASGNISYIYDATGVKLRKIVSTGTTTDYAGNYVYENGALQFFNTAEGYVEPVNASDYNLGFNYVYQYKDHLGNIRLSYSDKNKNGVILVSTDLLLTEIVEENNYYPFGLKHQGYNNAKGAMRNHKYGFNGKEEQDDDLGGNKLDWLDFHARNYDASLGRWMNVDPLADHPNQIDKSPYVYAVNNPILYNDPNGKCPPWICGALAGGLVEAGSQYIVNLAKGDSWTGAALNIDGADVLAATIEGGVTGGGSVARRLLVKGGTMVVSEVVQATVDVKIGNVVEKGLVDGTEIETDVKNIATDSAIGIGSNLIGEGAEGTMKAVINNKHTKELTQVNKGLKSSMKGSNGETVRLSKQAELNSTIKGNKVVSEATGTVTTEVLDEKLKEH